jgi:hypothetical protein
MVTAVTTLSPFTDLKEPSYEREDVMADLRHSGLLDESDPNELDLLLNGTLSACVCVSLLLHV